MNSTLRRILVHPAIRRYREPLYRKLGEDLHFEFLWTAINNDRPHESREVYGILESFPFPNRIAKSWDFCGISNLSPELLAVLQFDTVILSSVTSVPFLLLAPLLKRLGKRTVLFDELWRYQAEVPPYRRIAPYVQHTVLNCVDAIVTAGSASRRMFVEDWGFPPNRTFTAYNNTSDFTELLCHPKDAEPVLNTIDNFAKGRKVILYLGRLVRYKGLDVLIRALLSISKEACLVVVGSGPFESQCQRLAKLGGLGNRILFLGSQPSDLAPFFYKRADVYVQPARYVLEDPVNCESWGFTINEALSLSKPVVATSAIGAAYDLITNRETGIVVPPEEPDALALAVGEILDKPDFAKALGEKGRIRVKSLCSVEQSFNAFLSAISLAESR